MLSNFLRPWGPKLVLYKRDEFGGWDADRCKERGAKYKARLGSPEGLKSFFFFYEKSVRVAVSDTGRVFFFLFFPRLRSRLRKPGNLELN